jgi:hypothetical protein
LADDELLQTEPEPFVQKAMRVLADEIQVEQAKTKSPALTV